MPRSSLSLAEARRVALASQGFGRPRPTANINVRHIRNVIHNLGLLQLDFVNVLIPAHYMVLYSRLGPYEPERFRHLVYRTGEFAEQWAHEASIVPVSCWSLLEHRRLCFEPWSNSPLMKLENRAEYLSEVIDIVRDRGPVTSNDLPPLKGPKRRPGDWHRSVPRWALEFHFGQGNVAVADRLPNFQRSYDLPERLIPEPHFGHRVGKEEAQRQLLRKAGDSLGIGTLQDLADYYRMSPRDARARVNELVEDGSLNCVSVEGWQQPAFLSASARLPRRISISTLLSPFDPVVWFRPRAERLFDFQYRIEIYVPESKRKWGYYVLPFLLDDRLVARVDLKADRKDTTLLVQATHPEQGIDTAEVVEKLSEELTTLSLWLGLARIKVRKRGEFARLLAARLRISSAL